jgi:hypothetical protein
VGDAGSRCAFSARKRRPAIVEPCEMPRLNPNAEERDVARSKRRGAGRESRGWEASSDLRSDRERENSGGGSEGGSDAAMVRTRIGRGVEEEKENQVTA